MISAGRYAIVLALLSALVLWCAAAAGAGAIQPAALSCELQTNPTGIDVPRPRLAWKLDFDAAATSQSRRGAVQSAWQIIVATSPEGLQPGKADLWDSGRQESSQTLNIIYTGKALQSNQTAYWTVRVWDQKRHPSEWAKPATFTMALLSSDDWKGQWIGTQPRDQRSTHATEKLYWMWSVRTQDEQDYGFEPGSHTQAGGAVRYFRSKIDVPADANPNGANIYVMADNEGMVYLNGKLLGESTSHETVTMLRAGAALKPGEPNLLCVRVKNGGRNPNAAGLGIVFEIPTSSETLYLTAENSQWESSRYADKSGWPRKYIKAGKAAEWMPVQVLGPIGVSPWKQFSLDTHPTLPLLRKEFQADKKIRRALAHVCGLGQYVFYINDKKVGQHFLDPAWSLYEKTAYYNSFDVTPDMLVGDNAIGIMLGKGFYNTAGDRRVHGVQADRPLALMFQLDVEYEDGSTTRIVSDTSWKWEQGPVLHNSILGGVDYDAQRLPAKWATAGFDDAAWQNAVVTNSPGGKLTAAAAPPMRTFEERGPVAIEQPEAGHFVYKFGQNISAVPRITVRGKAGSSVKLTWAEQREGQAPHTNDGTGAVSQSGIGSGYITYTLRGEAGGETWMPQMFYTGFQYIEVTDAVPAGQPNPKSLPVIEMMTQVHVRTDEAIAGTFVCSNEMYNRIDRLIDAAVRSNLGHVFTDCPTREKLGWLEVPWLMWASVASRYDMDAFAEKITRDIRDSQRANGQIPTVAPAYPHFKNGFDYTAEWGAAGVFVPWYAYRWYGDRGILEQNFAAMKRFVDYLEVSSAELIAAPGLGDWYDYGHGAKLGASQFTPPELTATAVFAGCADAVSNAAAVLGKTDDQHRYAELAAKVRVAFNKTFRTAPGMYKNSGSPQTANAMAIVFKMVPDNEREIAAQGILQDLKMRDWQQTSGDVGYRFLINALAETDHSDAIFRILNRNQLGSYCFIVNAGWTSLPEAWNAYEGSSFNHCMLGHIQEWFTQRLLGISQKEDSLGFDRITFQPTPGGDVTSATGTLNGPRGHIALTWQKHGGKFTCTATVPPNSRAVFRLPLAKGAPVTEGGVPVEKQPDIEYRGRIQGREVFEVGAGEYEFSGTAL